MGFWKKNKMHGKGEMVWPDGRKYEGDYFEDKKHGYGILTFADGKKYKGGWEHGK